MIVKQPTYDRTGTYHSLISLGTTVAGAGMLRYKTETRPGLVALYDIRPQNGAGQFLQPWSPHGALV